MREAQFSIMHRVKIRPQELSDAGRFFEILTQSDFEFIEIPVETLEDEKRFLKLNEAKRKTNFEHNYSILFDEKLVGICGIRIDQHRPWMGEIGYLVDNAHRGQGIATEAVRQLEKIGFDELKLQRIAILMDIRNFASEQVARKCGYEKEGVAKKIHRIRKEYYDCFVYAKTR